MKPSEVNYTQSTLHNRKCVEIINRAWGEQVAWVDDAQAWDGRWVSVIKSRLARGLIPGKSKHPPFQSPVPLEFRKPRRNPRPRAELAAAPAPDQMPEPLPAAPAPDPVPEPLPAAPAPAPDPVPEPADA
jgi:hypothetical protein